MRRTMMVAMSAVVLAGCSGGGGDAVDVAAATSTTIPSTSVAPTTTEVAPASSATTTITTTTTVATTTTIDPVIAGQLAYFGISSELNAQLFDIESRYVRGDIVPTSTLREYCQELAVLAETWVNRMKAETWPADAQDEVDAMIQANAVSAGNYYQCAGSSSSQAALEFLSALPIDTGAEASAVRAALGLPIDR